MSHRIDAAVKLVQASGADPALHGIPRLAGLEHLADGGDPVLEGSEAGNGLVRCKSLRNRPGEFVAHTAIKAPGAGTSPPRAGSRDSIRIAVSVLAMGETGPTSHGRS
jgi:hypothetical protein